MSEVVNSRLFSCKSDINVTAECTLVSFEIMLNIFFHIFSSLPFEFIEHVNMSADINNKYLSLSFVVVLLYTVVSQSFSVIHLIKLDVSVISVSPTKGNH